MSKDLFENLAKLPTEQRNPRSTNLDALSVEDTLRLINSEDQAAPQAVASEIPHIAQAVECVVDALRAGGRLIYVGAGTSGRLGVLDAAECSPTFGCNPEMVQAVLAGGRDAMFEAQEGCEDRPDDGAAAMQSASVTAADVVCGLSASGRTPFVAGALREARSLGAKTVYVTTVPRDEFKETVDVAICAAVGPEVLTGSTRMKSGTAQKLILNMITTTAMVRLGKVYENLMVDVQANNEKLRERAKRIVMTVTGVSYHDAQQTLDAADGHVKTALIMLLAGVDAPEAHARLEQADGFVRGALRM